jgi:GntR family transcriptional regulator, transcriptional repressor for pyruvate dehydrogenase complex
MKQMFKPFEGKRYSEQIASLIQKKIIDDEIMVGSRLPTERQLAEELRVSRSVVREALRILDLSGHVQIKKGPRGGIFVSNVYHKPISVSLKNMADNGLITIDDMWDVRTSFEPLLVMQATRNAGKEDLKRLNQLFEDAEKHFSDAVYLKNKNFEFHIVLADISGNPILSTFMKAFLEMLAEIAYNFLDLTFEQNLLQIHKDLAQAIARRKPMEAKKILHRDVLFLKESLKKSLSGEKP